MLLSSIPEIFIHLKPINKSVTSLYALELLYSHASTFISISGFCRTFTDINYNRDDKLAGNDVLIR